MENLGHRREKEIKIRGNLKTNIVRWSLQKIHSYNRNVFRIFNLIKKLILFLIFALYVQEKLTVHNVEDLGYTKVFMSSLVIL
jgi:hypothetical protein